MALPTLLAFSTLGFVAAFAYISARTTRKRLEEGNFKRSTLCATSKHWEQAREEALA